MKVDRPGYHILYFRLDDRAHLLMTYSSMDCFCFIHDDQNVRRIIEWYRQSILESTSARRVEVTVEIH